VYEAEDVEKKHRLALKLSFSEEDAENMEREFEALSGLEGEAGIIRVYGLIRKGILETMREDGSVRQKQRQPVLGLALKLASKGNAV